MTVNITSAEEHLTQLALFLKTVDMFPVFYAAHFSIACLIVREDSKDLGAKFRQNHPFAIWLCTIIASVSGVFVANFLFGDPLIGILKENTIIAFITILWYFMNYSPFDVLYKVVTFRPVFLSAVILQECLRVRFIYLGLQQAAKVYPGAYLIIILGGVIKGNGYGYIKIIERLIRGKWTPSTNDILDVTYSAKSSMYASVLLLLHHIQLITMPIELLYFGIIVSFVVFRLMIVIGGIKDPLLPLESPLCALLFGSGAEEKDLREMRKSQKSEQFENNKIDSENKEKKTK